MPKGQHVFPSPSGGWSVRKTGSSKATKTFPSKKDAVDAARQIARNQKTELYVHGRDGRIEQRDSYGSEPSGPRGK
jgi:hypothetical protein